MRLCAIVSKLTIGNNQAKDATTCQEDGTCVTDNDTASPTTVKSNNDDSNNSSNNNSNIDPNCKDDDPEASCFVWAVAGECEQNPGYMLLKCQKSCGVCNGGKKAQREVEVESDGSTTTTTNKAAATSATATSSSTSEEKLKLPSSPENGWGLDQEVLGTPLQMMATQAVVEQASEYMLQQVFVLPQFEKVRTICKNRDALCSFWASAGECVQNVKFMQSQCAPACQTCDKVDFMTRCPFDATSAALANVWNSTFGLNDMFQRMITDNNDNSVKQQQQPMTIHRRPKSIDTKEDDSTPDGPWIVSWDNFLSPEQCESLLQLGQSIGYQGATAIGDKRFDGTYENQAIAAGAVNTHASPTTMKVAWCLSDSCQQETLVESILHRWTQLTGIPTSHWEFLQFQQFPPSLQPFIYETHDFASQHLDRAQGPRILTIHIFLTDHISNSSDADNPDNVSRNSMGAAIRFPKLDHLTILPLRGRAVVWPNVVHSNPNEQELRTLYQTLPVSSSTSTNPQYGLTLWVHLRDFKTPHKAACI